jgi:hypothetical protein
MSRHYDLHSKFRNSQSNYFVARGYYNTFDLFPPDNHISLNNEFRICTKGKAKLNDLENIFINNNTTFVEFAKYNILISKGTIIDLDTFKYDVITFIKNKEKTIKIAGDYFHRNTNLVTYVTNEFISNNNKLFLHLFEFILKYVEIKIVSRDKLDTMIISNNYKI